MKIYAAVDIGGTYIKYGIIGENGSVLSFDKTATEAEKGPALLQQKVIEIIQSLSSKHPYIDGIGVSTAGIVDSKEGRIIYANDNMPGYIGTEWKKTLQKHFHLPVSVCNDVNAAALAEAWVGAAKGVDNFFCMTIGTGVGGAAFVDCKLYQGAHNRAAEIGYMLTQGPAQRYEKFASVSALLERAEHQNLQVLSMNELFKLNNLSKNILEEWYESLACGIANVICLFDPSLILIGGGVSSEGENLISGIKKSLAKVLPHKPLYDDIEFKLAECGNAAGMIGSIFSFLHP